MILQIKRIPMTSKKRKISIDDNEYYEEKDEAYGDDNAHDYDLNGDDNDHDDDKEEDDKEDDDKEDDDKDDDDDDAGGANV